MITFTQIMLEVMSARKERSIFSIIIINEANTNVVDRRIHY